MRETEEREINSGSRSSSVCGEKKGFRTEESMTASSWNKWVQNVAAVFPPRFRTELYPVIVNFQDKLGDINDLSTAQENLRDKLKKSRSAARKRELAALLVAEEQGLKTALGAFCRECTREMLQHLHREFDCLLREPSISPEDPPFSAAQGMSDSQNGCAGHIDSQPFHACHPSEPTRATLKRF